MATFNEILQKHKLALIDFSATWCGPCQQLAPILEEVKKHYGEDLSIIKIDVDKNQSLASNFRVQGVPTLILFKDSEQVWRQSGLLMKNNLVQVIDQYRQA